MKTLSQTLSLTLLIISFTGCLNENSVIKEDISSIDSAAKGGLPNSDNGKGKKPSDPMICQEGDVQSISCTLENATEAKQSQLCQNNAWVDSDSCMAISCASGYELQNNICVAVVTVTEPVVCQEGEVQSISCILENATESKQNQVCQNNAWVDSGSCVAISCASGYELQNNTCVAVVAEPTPSILAPVDIPSTAYLFEADTDSLEWNVMGGTVTSGTFGSSYGHLRVNGTSGQVVAFKDFNVESGIKYMLTATGVTSLAAGDFIFIEVFDGSNFDAGNSLVKSNSIDTTDNLVNFNNLSFTPQTQVIRVALFVDGNLDPKFGFFDDLKIEKTTSTTVVESSTSTVTDRLASSAGCTDSYAATVSVNSASALASAVSNASVSTKIIVSDGTYGAVTLNGNSAAVCVEAANQNQAIFSSGIKLAGNNIVLSKLKITGNSSLVEVTGNDCRITLTTFDNAGKPYYIKTSNNFRTEIDHSTMKNLASGLSIALIFMSSYADDAAPSKHYIHHNYFVDLNPETVIQNRLRISHTDDTGLGEDFGQPGWNFGRDEYKNDEFVMENNYFLRTKKPINAKMNGTILRNNTFRDCERLNFRAGKDGILENNYFIGSGGIDVIDKNHVIRNNYFEATNSRNLGAIQISNGGYNGSLNNFREAATNVSVTGNYIKDTTRGIYFGLKIDTEGYRDLAPEGSVINNTFVNVDAPIHINTSGEPLMQNMTTTPNNTTQDPGWDMSGAYDSTDVSSGIVGSGI